jgi:hypothetical protein
MMFRFSDGLLTHFAGRVFATCTVKASPTACVASSDALRVALNLFQDLSERNILVNYFGDSIRPSRDDRLRDVFLLNDKALYAIFDYNLSVVFSPGTSSRERRLPFEMSFNGLVFDRPYDTAQGEFDYDPFAWDVACLGIQLRDRFQVCSHSQAFEGN